MINRVEPFSLWGKGEEPRGLLGESETVVSMGSRLIKPYIYRYTKNRHN